MVDVKSFLEQTKKELGLKDEDLNHIDEKYVKEVDEFIDISTVIGDADGGVEKTRWGMYGNSIGFTGKYVTFKSNKKGTPNYGCGTSLGWKVEKSIWATYIKPKYKCSDGKQEYFIGNYDG